jgi:galactokinase
VKAFRAPGRVNLIGDHTDYNDGFVLPLAIDRECIVRVGARSDGNVVVRSEQLSGEVSVPADGSADPASLTGWGRYVAGVVRVLAERGRPAVGVEATVSSTVPVGGGVSSSAALEVALALALCDAASFSLPPLELARACQEAEHVATGVPCGIMDQLTAVAGHADAALLIDCRNLTVEPVPLPPDLAVLVVHSGVSRSLDETRYAERRAECEEAATALGLASLREATLDQVRDLPRARHVVSENARVLAASAALRVGAYGVLGEVLSAGHVSLRDDFEVSTPELDALVTMLAEGGALGARLTGAGFGGSVVALTLRGDAEDVAERAMSRLRGETRLEPSAFVCRAAAGAGPLPEEDPSRDHR